MLALPLAGLRVQNQSSPGSDLAEVKHLGDGAGQRIEGALANALPAQPVVLDEMDDGGLIGYRMVHEVLLRPR